MSATPKSNKKNISRVDTPIPAALKRKEGMRKISTDEEGESPIAARKNYGKKLENIDINKLIWFSEGTEEAKKDKKRKNSTSPEEQRSKKIISTGEKYTEKEEQIRDQEGDITLTGENMEESIKEILKQLQEATKERAELKKLVEDNAKELETRVNSRIDQMGQSNSRELEVIKERLDYLEKREDRNNGALGLRAGEGQGAGAQPTWSEK